MVKKKRFTKKMLEVFDRSEIRRLAVVSMELPTEKAYMLDFKGLISWVFENKDVLSEANLDPNILGVDDYFRDGVHDYVMQLQGFLKGDEEAPEWPPIGGEIEADEETPLDEVEYEESEPEQEEAREKLGLKEPTTSEDPVEGLEETVDEELEPMVEEKDEKPAKRKLVRRKKAATEEAPAAAQEPARPVVMDIKPIVDAINELRSGMENLGTNVGEEFAKLGKQAGTYRDMAQTRKSNIDALNLRVTGLENALLVIVNLLIEDGEPITSIAELPDPAEMGE